MKKFLATSAIALILGACGGQNAHAQAIDYTSLQELFGEPVTTSANGSPQVESEVPLNMDIITQDEIAKTGARSIPEVLRRVPGVTVRRHTFGQYEVSIRGYNQLNAERILVLLNGRQVYLDYFGQVNWENIPVEMAEIKQVEVVKGPNTALFGFNAVSGVVNIITYNPLYDDVGKLEVRGGTNDLTEASAVKTLKFGDRAGARISAGGFDAGEFEEYSDLYNIVEEDVSRRSALIDTWFQLTDNVQLQLEASRNNYIRNEEIVTRTASAVDYETTSIRGRILADTDFGLWEADVYHNGTRADINLLLDANTGALAPFQFDNRVTVAKLNNTFKVGADHTFRLGAEYREGVNIVEGLGSIAGQLDQGSDLENSIFGVSGLWDYSINPKLSSSIAIRFDTFDLNKDGPVNNVFVSNTPGASSVMSEAALDRQSRNEWSYNLGLVYEPTNKDTFRATAARGIDLPSFTEFGLQFIDQGNGAQVTNSGVPVPGAVTGLTFLGDPETKSSIVHNFELGYNRDIKKIDGQLKTSLFYQYNDEMQGFGARYIDTFNADLAVSGIDPVDSFLGNLGDSEAYGFEVGLDGRYEDNLSWGVSYAFIEIDDDLRNFGLNPIDPGGSFSSINEYEDSVSNHRISAQLGYTYENWTFDVFGQYVTSFDDIIPDPGTDSTLQAIQVDVDDEFLLNANIAWDVTDNLRWSVSGTSLAGDVQQNGRYGTETVVYTTVGVKF